jgi:hypothetical protein
MRISKGYNELKDSDLKIKVIEINGDYHDPSSGAISLSSNWIADSPTLIKIFAELDMDGLQSNYQLSENDKLKGVLRSYCKSTAMQHFGKPVALIGNEITLEILIPEFEWSDQATLKMSITHDSVDNLSFIPGKAILDKSRLGEREWSLVLSGTYSRSDVQSVSFASAGGKNNGFWEISITPPIDIDSWLTVEQSSVVRIRINENRVEELDIPQIQMLLKVDMIMSALDAVFDAEISEDARNEVLEMIFMAPDGSGSWLRFLSNVLPIAFPQGLLGITQFWHGRKDEIRTRIQSYVSDVS